MSEQLPGVNIHVHEGRVTGNFELPPAEMQQVSYGGRVVLVLVADVSKVNIADTREGDTKASWTFKAVDAGVVRDPSMKDHLANVLYLDGLEPTLPLGEQEIPGPTMVGVYDDEGAFLGFTQGDEPTSENSVEESENETLRVVPETRVGVGATVNQRDPVLAQFLQEP